jgi:hypothetical protein
VLLLQHALPHRAVVVLRHEAALDRVQLIHGNDGPARTS